MGFGIGKFQMQITGKEKEEEQINQETILEEMKMSSTSEYWKWTLSKKQKWK